MSNQRAPFPWLASPPTAWGNRPKSRYPAHGHPSKDRQFMYPQPAALPSKRPIDDIRIRHHSCKCPLKKRALLQFSSFGLCSTPDAGHLLRRTCGTYLICSFRGHRSEDVTSRTLAPHSCASCGVLGVRLIVAQLWLKHRHRQPITS
jgi:hypothetical protein